MKWGELYSPDYVNVLQSAVSENLSYPHDFVCITDNSDKINPLIKTHELNFVSLDRERWNNGMWPKIEMFNPSIVGSYDIILFFDLDIVITNNLDEVIDLIDENMALFIMPKFRGLIWRMIPKWIWNLNLRLMSKVTKGNSSIVGFKPRDQLHMYNAFDNDLHTQIYKNDQDYISQESHNRLCFPKGWFVPLAYLLDYWPISLFRNRYRVRPRGTKAVVFNGNPNPIDVIHENTGEWGTKRRPAYGSVSWVAEYWSKHKL